MSDNNTEKKRGRPSKGVDGQRITVRISNEQARTLSKYCREYGFVTKTDGMANYSDAIRALIDDLSHKQTKEFSATCDTILHNLGVASQVLQAYALRLGETGDEKERDAVLSIADSVVEACMFTHAVACYEDWRKDIKQRGFVFDVSSGNIDATEQPRIVSDKK